MKNEDIIKRITSFLSERKLSSGGWADVSDAEIIELSDIIQAIISAKWQEDADNSCPVEFNLVNRTKYERNHFFNIPYEHKAKTEEQKDECLDIAVINMKIASDVVSRIWRIRKHTKQ